MVEEQEQKDHKNTLDFLYKAIDDAQNTIRFTDTKAGAVIAFWTTILTLTFRHYSSLYSLFFSSINNMIEQVMLIILIVILGWFLIKSIWMSYMTLVPRINPKQHINHEDFEVDDLFFLANTVPKIQGKYLYKDYENLKMELGSKEYYEKLSTKKSEGIIKELIMELQKVSFIRNLKLARTNLAISSVIQSCITMILVLIYIIGQKIIAFKGGVILNDIHLNISLFIILYIGHKVADYLFQTEFQAINKDNNWWALIRHSFVYTLILTVLAFLIIGFFNWTAVFILFISHVFIDKRNFLIWWSKHIKKMSNTENDSVRPVLMELDQAFHYVIIFIVSFL